MRIPSGMSNSFPYIAVGAFIWLLCAILVLVSAGAGHGTYGPAKVLFPLSVILADAGQRFLSILVSIIQFPIYSAFVGRVHKGKRILTICVIASIHTAVSWFAFAYAKFF